MANARLDDNSRYALIAVSSVDGSTPVRLYADPTTHRLLVDNVGGGTSSGYQLPTGVVNGSNRTYVYATAPNAVVVDGTTLQQTEQGGQINWTGTTTIILAVAPNFSTFSVA